MLWSCDFCHHLAACHAAESSEVPLRRPYVDARKKQIKSELIAHAATRTCAGSGRLRSAARKLQR